MFRRQFTLEEKIRWQNTLKQLFINTGPDDLGLEFFNLVGGIKERKFAEHVDRTKPDSNIMVCYPIPEKRPSLLYKECMATQAQYIRSVLQEYALTPYLLWSGGLDSTGVFYALLDEGIRFNVVFDESSYAEYPKVAQDILDGKFNNVTPIFGDSQITFPEHPEQNKDAVYITGDGVAGLGDLYKFDYATRQLPIELCINKHISQALYEATAPSIYTIVENPTLSEYLWAMDFIYKYHGILLRLGAIRLSSYGPKQNTINFFDTDEFQLYALNHYKEDCNFSRNADYKMPLKQYILDLNGDQEYFKNKCVEGSYLIGAYST